MPFSPVFSAGLSGFFLGASLIIAIGAQNAFILRQGLLREHVFILCLICALSDALLIALGVAGFGSLIATSETAIRLVTWAGAAFLTVYGLIALRRAWRPHALRAEKDGHTPLATAVAICLSFTFLNPHVYLDTVVLLGGISAGFEGQARLAFGTGAVLASFVWFYALGYGARLLQPVFAKPRAWQVLDLLIAFVMFALAVSLVA
ncbi:LysE/ArgO family amino acid transporter [Oricola cellulosilytica]|uniref:Amino acid transporter n=1 Tax=Oricola cellulosilytica TaxID=1429082 RepID=A0A4R0PAJ8_9HYPH|nr:LysE/ArgO family amino acid transporter [Oricola cellulosilytica]TCD14272.1 amino acid transporter [Oricola cellulosilytica]